MEERVVLESGKTKDEFGWQWYICCWLRRTRRIMRYQTSPYILEYSLLGCTNSYNILPSCFRCVELLQALVCDQGGSSKHLARLPRTILPGRWPLVRPIMQQCRSILCLLPTRDGSARAYSQRTETRRQGGFAEGVRMSAVCGHAGQQQYSCSLPLSSTETVLARSKLSSYLAIQKARSEHMSYRKSQVAGGSRVQRVFKWGLSS
jgi:hypothetical protein